MTTISFDMPITPLINPSIFGMNLGVSESAITIRREDAELRNSLAQPITYGEHLSRMLEGLLRVKDMCSVDNWDGYNAKTIDSSAFQNAFMFALSLPSTIPAPEIYADPDGEVAFEWYEDRRRVFSISFGSKNRISYAGTYGSNKTYGVEYFYDDIPDVILNNIKRLYSE